MKDLGKILAGSDIYLVIGSHHVLAENGVYDTSNFSLGDIYSSINLPLDLLIKNVDNLQSQLEDFLNEEYKNKMLPEGFYILSLYVESNYSLYKEISRNNDIEISIIDLSPFEDETSLMSIHFFNKLL